MRLDIDDKMLTTERETRKEQKAERLEHAGGSNKKAEA